MLPITPIATACSMHGISKMLQGMLVNLSSQLKSKAEKLSQIFILLFPYSVVALPYIVGKTSLSLAAQRSRLIKVRSLTHNVQLYKSQDHFHSFPDFFKATAFSVPVFQLLPSSSYFLSALCLSHLEQTFRFRSRCLHSRHPQRQTQICPMTRWSPISREYALPCWFSLHL